MCAGALIPETQFNAATTASVRSLTLQSFPSWEGGREMAILRLLQNSQLAAEDLARLVAAHEKTLQALCQVDRSDPITELVARKVIEISQSGVRDPAQISRLAVRALS
jgi:hypothetical protein